MVKTAHQCKTQTDAGEQEKLHTNWTGTIGQADWGIITIKTTFVGRQDTNEQNVTKDADWNINYTSSYAIKISSLTYGNEQSIDGEVT